jgi:alpha-D-ribose 1-methylphosphonate 5-triphosphate diphosphatase
MDQFNRHLITVIENTHALTPAGWRRDVSLVLRGGVIEEITSHRPAADVYLPGDGRYALPGIVDIHGDAFERHITPRAGVDFPIDMAVQFNDAGLVAAGITTFFYSITDGFEPGLRSRQTVRAIMQALNALRGRLLCDSRVHIRHEQANTDDHDELSDWMKTGRIDLLSLNNHLPPAGDDQAFERYIPGFRRRVAMDEADAAAFLRGIQDRIPQGALQVEDLARLAQAHNVPLASHDDVCEADVQRALLLGVDIAEFPLNFETAEAFREAGVHVVMGAPNGVRGRSHLAALGVRDAIAAGAVDVLCSDYHYPSLFRVPFLLNELGILNLPEAWTLVSANPAQAVGLEAAKGRLEPGMAADVLLLNGLTGAAFDIAAVLVDGRLVLQR